MSSVFWTQETRDNRDSNPNVEPLRYALEASYLMGYLAMVPKVTVDCDAAGVMLVRLHTAEVIAVCETSAEGGYPYRVLLHAVTSTLRAKHLLVVMAYLSVGNSFNESIQALFMNRIKMYN